MDHKSSVRERVWADLRKVARADSRFHYDFGEFIADFEDGDVACARLTSHEYYRNSELILIAPDNCIERLRLQAFATARRCS